MQISSFYFPRHHLVSLTNQWGMREICKFETNLREEAKRHQLNVGEADYVKNLKRNATPETLKEVFGELKEK